MVSFIDQCCVKRLIHIFGMSSKKKVDKQSEKVNFPNKMSMKGSICRKLQIILFTCSESNATAFLPLRLLTACGLTCTTYCTADKKQN